MTIIDSQVHAYEANTPKRPWHSVPNWPDHVTGDEMVAAMDKVGVDGAIFISAFSLYRYDASYAVEVQRAHPGRLAIVKPVDPDDPDVADVIAEWKKTPGAVAIRIRLTKDAKRAPDDPASTGLRARRFAMIFRSTSICRNASISGVISGSISGMRSTSARRKGSVGGVLAGADPRDAFTKQQQVVLRNADGFVHHADRPDLVHVVGAGRVHARVHLGDHGEGAVLAQATARSATELAGRS